MGANTAFTVTELVYLPASRVWALLTDWTAAPAWMTGVTRMSPEGPIDVGLDLDYESDGHSRTASITALHSGHSFTLTTGTGDVRADYRYELNDDGGDTRLSLTADVVVSSELAEMAPQIRHAVADADAGQLAAFKRYAEAAP